MDEEKSLPSPGTVGRLGKLRLKSERDTFLWNGVPSDSDTQRYLKDKTGLPFRDTRWYTDRSRRLPGL